MNPKRESQPRKSEGSSPVVRRNIRVVRAVSYSDLGDSTIADVVRLVTGYGAAIMFGCTSDGGAYSICVLDNDQKIKEYPHTPDDFESVCIWLRDEYFGHGGKSIA